MNQEKRIEYLLTLNKELVRELTRFDLTLTNTRLNLGKQQKAFKLLLEIQKVIGYSKSDKELYTEVAELIDSVLGMVATYIFEPIESSPGEFRLLCFHETVEEKVLVPAKLKNLRIPENSGYDDLVLINRQTSHSYSDGILNSITGLSSLIFSPVKYNDSIEILIITGIKVSDSAFHLDLTQEDLETLGAVNILISSYLRKVELIRLNEKDKFKTEFVSNISHEFRTPLTLILGLLEQVKNDMSPNLDDKSLDKIEIIINNADRIKQLINQLLDISRIETNTERLSVRKLSLGDLITTIARSFFSLAQKNRIEFRFSFSDSSNESWFDQDKLEKILTNLLSNAFKFTGEKGKVELSVYVEDQGSNTIAVFSISDTGAGIPPGESQKVFERFYQVKKGKKDYQDGTGIGLYMVKIFTELHHGDVSLTSKVNMGSVFTIKIPINKNAYSNDELFPENEIISKTKNTKGLTSYEIPVTKSVNEKKKIKPVVLIVEDHIDLNSYIESGLIEDFSVLCAYNGKQGLESAILKIPDLIITDIMMPELDGYEMTTKLKENDKTRHIPIIMLTAKADKISKIEGLECGADDYMCKPFDMDELSIKVRNHIETTRCLREKFREDFLTTPDESEIPSPVGDNLVKNVIELIKVNLQDSDFQVSDICHELFISRTQLYRKIEALTGYNPGELMRIIRLKSAAAMFRKGHGNVAQVMYQVGFNNQSNFTKIFRAQFGTTPSAYLRNYQSN